MSGLALTNDERKLLLEKLADGIDHAGLNLDEFIFATSELLKSHFWLSMTQGRDDEEVELIRARLVKAVDGVAEVLEGTTETISEDMTVLFTMTLEAVNQIFAAIKEREQEAELVE